MKDSLKNVIDANYAYLVSHMDCCATFAHLTTKLVLTTEKAEEVGNQSFKVCDLCFPLLRALAAAESVRQSHDAGAQ